MHMCHWKVWHQDWSVGDSLDEPGVESRCSTVYKEAWRQFRRVFNHWLVSEPGQGLQAHCSTHALTAEAVDALKRDAKHAIKNLLYRCMPVRPQKGKWTLTLRSFLWFQLACTMNVLKLSIPLAYSKLLYKIERNLAEYKAAQSSYNTEVAYEKVEGSCLRSFNNGAKKEMLQDSLNIPSLILEPLAYLTRWFLRASSAPRRQRMQRQGLPAPLCDLVDERYSPVTVLLEYLAMLLDGTAPRLLLLIGRKHANFEDWCLRNPQLLSALRRGTTVAMSWMWVRTFVKYSVFPWKLAIVVDPRQSQSTIDKVLQEFEDAVLEVMDECFTYRLRNLLKKAGLSCRALLSGMWHRILLLWVWLVITSAAPVEFCHGRNFKRSMACETWGMFAAKFILDESKRDLQSFLKGLDDTTQRSKLGRPSHYKEKRQRTPSARDLFNSDFNKG